LPPRANSITLFRLKEKERTQLSVIVRTINNIQKQKRDNMIVAFLLSLFIQPNNAVAVMQQESWSR